MRNASLGSPIRGEGTPWWMALRIPVMVLALIGTLWIGKYLGDLNERLASHGGPRVQCLGGRIINALAPARSQDLLCLELAFTPDNASAVFAAWSLTPTGASDAAALRAKIETARKSIQADWLFILCYTVSLSSFGLLLMWLLRYEQHTFAPVLLCCPIIAGMLDWVENLCILEMLAHPDQPPAAAAALGGAASAVKWAFLLVVVPVAMVWALIRLPRRARSARQVVENFSAVVAAERAYVAERRKLADPGRQAPDPKSLRPIGLALSGGGIRSATFNLGVLQALSCLGVLRYVDYLSTVSGGGYIGSCLTSLLSHPSKPKPEPDSHSFDPGEAAYFATDKASFPFNPNAVEQPSLRGFDGRDQLRHLRMSEGFVTLRNSRTIWGASRAIVHAFGLMVCRMLVALFFLAGTASLTVSIVVMMIGNPVVLFMERPGKYLFALLDSGNLGYIPFGSAVLAGVMACLLSLPLGQIAYVLPVGWLDSQGQTEEGTRDYFALWTVFWVIITTAVAVSWFWIRNDVVRLAFLALPLGVCVGGLLMTTMLFPVVVMWGGSRRDFRFRLSKLHALFVWLTAAALWIAVAPYFFVNLSQINVEGLLIALPTLPPFAQLMPSALEKLRLGAQARDRLLKYVRNAVGILFGGGGLVLLCGWIVRLQSTESAYSVRFPLAVGLTALALFTLLGLVFDFNKLSLHYFYRDPLVATYLQTSAWAPDGERVEVIKRDDSEMSLTELLGKRHDAPGPAQPVNACVTSAPYHLLMTALNLTTSRDMTRRNRKSDYFVFSKLYCGSESTGYMRTDRYRSGETSLAHAMTISGAAASSAVWAHTSLAQSFALTLLGVRLGQWMENPRYRDGRCANRNEGGVFWPFYFLREMIGSTDASRRLINLSDGGHTGDNVGICPLLKRRCAVIIACDAEADPKYTFGSLTKALRQIYIDENIRVEINLDRLRPDPATDRSASRWAVGEIRYPEGAVGYLLVLKPSFVGGADDSEPVKSYRQEHPEFPHETTADQFFDDDQFESYRELGERVCQSALSNVSDLAWCPEGDTWERIWDTQARISQGAAG